MPSSSCSATWTTAAMRSCSRAADELGLDALTEAHDAAELDRAIALDAPVIGVNARDLSTFVIDRDAAAPARGAGEGS